MENATLKLCGMSCAFCAWVWQMSKYSLHLVEVANAATRVSDVRRQILEENSSCQEEPR